MKKIKVHIVGTHGVPAKYGGFETLADFLCQHLGSEYDILVYCNAAKYPGKEPEYFGAKLKYLPLDASGFKGILYDLFTYVRSLFSADIILYLSPVGSGFMTPLRYLSSTKVIVNHGGLNEWEREKLSWFQQKWAKFNHRVAARFSTINIADNALYKQSLKDNFNADAVIIRYGGDHAVKVAADDRVLSKKYPFVQTRYAVSVSRAQIDNNIHIVLEAFENFSEYKIVLVSNWNISEYGKDLKKKYIGHPNMILLDAIYDKRELDYVRGNAYVYVHSHSRCGTAPSLVEAMNLKQAVVSYDAATNRETTHNKASYFSTPAELRQALQSLSPQDMQALSEAMYAIASKEYTWQIIAEQYSNLFHQVLRR